MYGDCFGDLYDGGDGDDICGDGDEITVKVIRVLMIMEAVIGMMKVEDHLYFVFSRFFFSDAFFYFCQTAPHPLNPHPFFSHHFFVF